MMRVKDLPLLERFLKIVDRLDLSGDSKRFVLRIEENLLLYYVEIRTDMDGSVMNIEVRDITPLFSIK